jgi:LytS/YehU family sensor histidine kinase
MKKINWYLFSLYMVMMSVIGFIVFDNISSSIIFGVCVGGIFGYIFSSSSSK